VQVKVKTKERGLKPIIEDLKEVFDMAREMCGGGNPEFIEENQENITKLEREVMKRLRRKVAK